jgi:hypothetical protein
MAAGPRRAVGVEERRARLARRHHLGPGCAAGRPAEVAADLLGLHGSDPASVFLAVRARAGSDGSSGVGGASGGGSVAAVERAFYDDRTLVRMLGMRRTMFAVPVARVPLVHAACTRAIAIRERTLLIGHLESGGTAADGGAWLDRVERATLDALAARGEALATELSADVPELAGKIRVGAGTKWETVVGASTRVLFVLAAAGHVVRARPRGSWTSSQYRWAPVEGWLGEPLDWVDGLDTAPARAEMARRWLAAFGPGTVADLKWWTGWTVGDTRRALAEVGPVEVDLDGGTGLVLPDDVEPVEPVGPWVALLPSLDPTIMGWTGRDWYLGAHAPALFDRSGNPGPTVWADGRIVGGWAQRKDGEVAVRLLEDAGAEVAAAVDAEAARLRDWLGNVRVTPRFRTPLERELTA